MSLMKNFRLEGPLNPTILVAGGAGYIGSHAVLALKQAGYQVVVIDNLVYGHRHLVENVLQVDFIQGDIGDLDLLNSIFSSYSVTAVMHFAGYAYVGESVENPAKYYSNNVVGTLTLLQAMVAASVKRLVFSSTCATYGTPTQIPITENHPQNPINPYGRSKQMVEQMLADFDTAYGLKSVCFRYFNAAGADPQGRLGEDHTPETHLIPLVLQTALGQCETISIFGTDYPTPDGTCIRDYIHVSDLAQAHLLGLQYLLNGGDSQAFNLSNGNGFSVREVIETAKAVTGRPIHVIETARRSGDPPVLVGSSHKVLKALNWQPQYPYLQEIVHHAWNWHQRRHGLALSVKTTLLQSTTRSETGPLVSVIIPAYNAEAFIARTLDSVIAQTYRNLEILVIDDGSQDKTAQIVRDYMQIDSRIQLLQQKNAGVAAARNLGIQNSGGEFIAPIDADDIWYPRNLEQQVQCLASANPDVGLVYSWSIDITENGIPTGERRTPRIEGQVYTTLLLHDFIANASSVLIRRVCIDEVGDYDATLKERYGQGGEDWDLYLRIAEHYQFRVVPEVLVGYRKLPNSMSKDFSQMARSRQLIWQSIYRKYPNIPKAIEHLSNSSFYLHLANQCYSLHRDKKAFYWLKKALRSDPLTPWLRIGTYKLLMFAALEAVYPKSQEIHLQAVKSESLILDREDSISAKLLSYGCSKNIEKSKPSAKSNAEQILHWLATAIFGSPYRWQKAKLN